MNYENPVEICPRPRPKGSVIWLHGLGADGNDFVPIIEMLDLPHLRYVLPHAPYRKVTINNGYEMRAWYDIFSLTPGSQQDEAGIRQSQSYIEMLIANEVLLGSPLQRIALAGFSQGGAIVLHTATRQQGRLAGVLALSTYLPIAASLATEKTVASLHTPIYMAHGNYDEIINIQTGMTSLEKLQSEGYQVDWHEYAMGHSVCAEEIADIRAFLLQVLPE
ncbi:MAG TPA: dienelactone hydrolase family protein [Methylophilus sp.]|nr:dienelactone hydrolase family protein [Methylophilus sp.]HQQ32859.1 dienelactone hydrolase family protein [Methylophilus sp.]